MGLKDILLNLPEVASPAERRLPFREKLKWTGIVLLLFFTLGLIPLYGLGANSLAQFQFLSIILGAEFGSIISLGIGPIVTASILLQLLNGSGVLKFDLSTPEGKKMFQGVQKGLVLVFILFEAAVYVYTGGLAPEQGGSRLFLVLQLMLGGFLILLMDEVVSKWGFGQGVSLFIAAGVSKEIIIRLLSPLSSSGNLAFSSGEAPVGALLAIFYFFVQGDFREVFANLLVIGTTVLVFIIAVYAQSMKVELPLSFGRIRGHGVRWPLAFIYTSNIPVILTAALIANVQLWVRLLQSKGFTFLGSYDPTGVSSGFVSLIQPVNIVNNLASGNLVLLNIVPRVVVFTLFMIGGSILFSVFWVKTAGMDARSQAKQIMSSGLQIPGFRRDERVVESLLERYIPALTVMGAITVGFLAAFADIMGALTSGTGLLLTVMIVYRLYEEIAHQHAYDMNPMLRRFIQQ
ncbi:preprotein translocase subunit SecY [Candidatus Woesearchaeota archaeon]|nr:preprotein translocase subunit SecY [Candidatus Woesearchaeota archaeon]